MGMMMVMIMMGMMGMKGLMRGNVNKAPHKKGMPKDLIDESTREFCKDLRIE